MEIERKYMIHTLPQHLEQYASHEIEQAYIITNPVLRIRKSDDEYFLTYKSSGLMVRQEEEFSIDEEAYQKLLQKTEGKIISKTRYDIPIENDLIATLDVFKGKHAGLLLVEVEFPSVELANAFFPPAWFGGEVTHDKNYQNSTLSQLSQYP